MKEIALPSCNTPTLSVCEMCKDFMQEKLELSFENLNYYYIMKDPKH